MLSGSLPSSKEIKNSHLQQPLNPIITLSTQSDPPIKPDLANPLEVDDDDEDFKGAAEQDQVLNPERSSSFLSVEVSAGPSVSFVSDGMMTSPSNSSRRTQKRKKAKGHGSYKKKQAIEKKLQTLSERLNLVPFIPKGRDLSKHEMLLKSLGLWDFVSIVMGSDFNDIRSELVSQLIATYDPKTRGSYVNDVKIKVNRADLARAFKLPLKKEKTGNAVTTDSGDLDLTGVSSEGSVAFLLDFVTSWVVLNNDEEVWIMPDEAAKLIKPIQDGQPELMDWSTLLWSMVEQELAQGEQLEHCNYAPHLQHLIRSQREDLLSMEPDEGDTSQDTRTVLQEVHGDEEEVQEAKGQDEEEKALTKDDVGEVSEMNGMDEGEKVMEKKDDGVEEMVLEVKCQASVEEVLEKNDDDELVAKVPHKEEAVVETDIGIKEAIVETEIGVKEETLVTEDGVKEQVLEMNEPDAEEVLLEKKDEGEEELLEKNDDGDEEKLEKKDEEEGLEKDWHKNVEILETKNDVEEEPLEKEKDDSKEEEELEGNVVPGFDLTLGQELVTEVGSKDAEMVEDLEVYNYDHVDQDQGQWLLNGKSSLGGHFLQRCSTRGNMVSSDCIGENDGIEEGEEEMVTEDGFDVLPTGIDEFQGEGLDVNFLGPKLSYGHHPSIDIMDSQNDLHESGPSFYHNNGKRKVHDDVHISRHGNDNKRFRTQQDSSYRQPEDFRTIIEQMQFFMDKAKAKYMEKEEEQEQSKQNQQLLFDELQKRDAVIERLQQVKQEEIEKRDTQIYRLNRELFLMCSLLEEYKKSLKKTDKAFNEYRQKNQLIPEEPMYKDAGNGLVLSIAEFEKQRQNEEEKLKSEIEQKASEAEEGYTLQFEEFLDKVNGLDKKLSVIENGFKSLKESFSRSKLSETSVPSDAPVNVDENVV